MDFSDKFLADSDMINEETPMRIPPRKASLKDFF